MAPPPLNFFAEGGREEGAVGAAGTVENARVEAARGRETDDGVSTTTGSISYPASSAAAGITAITNDYCAASTWMSSPTHKIQHPPITQFSTNLIRVLTVQYG